MGWTSSAEWNKKEKVISYLLTSVNDRLGGGPFTLARAELGAPGNNEYELFIVWRRPDGSVRCEIVLLERDGPREGYPWAYKSMDEECGPFTNSRPSLDLIALLPAPTTEFAINWRERAGDWNLPQASLLKAGVAS